MSLGIQKFDGGGQTPEVRRYKRYRDEVDLDDFVRQAELGFDTWLNNANIKDKYKDQVRAAYRDMITRIDSDPGSFTTSLGRVFYNTAGITNAKKGFDAYGVAASYIGNTLRGMQAYKEPEVKSNKSKYDRNGQLINSAIQNNIVGSDYRNFLRLDYDKDATELGTANRISQYISGLEKLAKNPDELYDFASDEDKQHFVSRINTAIEGLKNNNPNDDLFILGQLGFTDLDKFLYTGKLEQENDEQPTPEQKAIQLSQDQIRNFENYMETNHPFYTGNLISHNIDITEGTASREDAIELANKFRSLTDKQLGLWIVDYIRNPNYDFTQYPLFRQLYGGRYPRYNLFTSGQIMRQIFAQAIYNGLGKQIGNSEEYYFPFTLQQHSDKSSTVFVYNAKTLQFKQVDTQDIPFYQEQYFTEYRSANPGSDVAYAGDSRYRSRYPNMYPSQEKGGVLEFNNEDIIKPELENTDPQNNSNQYE